MKRTVLRLILALTILPAAKAQSILPGILGGQHAALGTSTTSINLTLSAAGSVSQTFTVTNTINAPVTISSLPTVSSSVFIISGPTSCIPSTLTCTLPLTLGIGQSATFTVTFSPAVVGTFSGTLSITSNPFNSPTNVLLSGYLPHYVSLAWTASTSLNVVGYNVYRSTASGAETGPPLNGGTLIPVSVCTTLTCTYTDSPVVAGTTYYYVVTSVDIDGIESVYSTSCTGSCSSIGEAEVLIPTP